METELDDDYRKPLSETRQEELARIVESERQAAMSRLIDGDDPEFERALKWSGYFLSNREMHIAATFWYLARQR